MSVNKKNSDGSYNQYASKPYVTKDNIGLSKVENKSSEDIRGEITSKNVTDALGYTPVNPNPQFIYDTEAKMTKVVPDGVNKGIVSMIGGKTQKKNLIKLNTITTATSHGVTYTPTFNPDGSLAYITINGTATANSTYMIGSVTPSENGKTISVGTTVDEARLVVELNEIPWTNYGLAYGTYESTVQNIPTGKVCNVYLNVQKDKIVNNVKCYPMIRPTTESSDYQPPFTLWSAPVEKVVLTGANLCTDNWVKGYYNRTTGEPVSYNLQIRNDDFIKVEPNTKYFIKRISGLVILYYTSNKSYISSPEPIFADTAIVTPSNCGYLRCYLAEGYGTVYHNDVMIIKSEAIKEFVPYTKTTLSLERIVENLPDYGASVNDEIYNCIDFERGVYVHRVTEVDLGTLYWKKILQTDLYGVILLLYQ